MARRPRATVSKTSGQGISRLSYQKGYKLRGDSGIKGPGKLDIDSPKSYGKAKGAQGGGINVSYGDTYYPTDLEELEQAFKEKPAKGGLNFKPGGGKKLK